MCWRRCHGVTELDRWTEVRSAYYVGKLGTVSAAASELKVHRATIMRHIDSLEQSLSAKLFQRHKSGYTPTDYGRGLFEVAARTELSFLEFRGRMEGQARAASGDLIITSTAILLSTLTPVLKLYQIENPGVRVEHVITENLARLEVGEAHVAIRTGSYEDMDDTVMLPLVCIRSALYAHRSYVDRYGKPKSLSEFRDHRFVSRVVGDERFAPFVWLREHIEPENVVFMSNDLSSKSAAIAEGLGIGFMPILRAEAYSGMVEIFPHNPAWDVKFWLVTHVDIHRMPKVQALLSAFRKLGFLNGDNEFRDILRPTSAL
ncbi:MAG: LysR family transcriptional regulator [Pseudomonadota bacterium]